MKLKPFEETGLLCLVCMNTPLDSFGRCPNCEPPEERVEDDDDYFEDDAFSVSPEPDFLSGPDREIDEGVEE